MGVFFRERRWRSARRPTPADAAQAIRRKFLILGGTIAVCFLALTVQLFRLQVLNVGHYQLQARDNRLKLEPIPPPRGYIYDRNGKPLAVNAATYYAAVIPDQLPDGHESDVYSALQAIVHVPAFEIEQKVNDARRRNDLFTEIVVKREIDYDSYLILGERQHDLPGVKVAAEPSRFYPTGGLMSHLLGYIGPLDDEELKTAGQKGYQANERSGKAGVESQYEGYLRGMPGKEEKEVDAAGRTVAVLGREDPRPGYNLVMSIDSDLQKAVAGILQESVADLGSKKAVAIVMDVRTGELLADVSLPTYDNNVFSHQIDDFQYEALTNGQDKPLLDHAIAEKFPPGSTFKIVTGLAALQEGVATPNTTITSNGALLVPRDYNPQLKDSFPDWRAGLGPLSFYRGVAMSSDVYFYCLAGGNCPDFANGLGNERLARYARNLGYGAPTGIDLPGETAGLIGTAEWLRQTTGEPWRLGDTFYMGIGQGYVEATPIQVVRATAAVANGGKLMTPRVVREIRDAAGNIIVPSKPDVARTVAISAENLGVMREAMRQSVADGTANTAAVPGIQIAGKTGTAEFGTKIGIGSVNGQYREHGWFTGFAPFDNPEIAVVVFHDQGGGALTAAPTAGRIIKAYFDLKEKRAASAAPATTTTP